MTLVPIFNIVYFPLIFFSGSVQLFKNGDLTGAFDAGDGKFSKGEYDFPQFKLKVDNDKTSSLEVPQGCMAQLFQHEKFEGDFAVFTPGTYTQEQMTKKGIANNDASSIKVQICRPRVATVKQNSSSTVGSMVPNTSLKKESIIKRRFRKR